MVDIIAFYLPQYHPIEENNKWYGEGFTEWTNVAKAKPLFKGHYQPHVPADLGFYDLRIAEVRQSQAEMAQKYGIAAFCYWNYWFGGGKQLLEKPLWDVFHDNSITLPFCMAWANHSWEKKQWDKNGSNEMLMEQLYLGADDYKQYFYTYLPIFKDNRYYKVDDKLFFIIYNPMAGKEIKVFIDVWQDLAKREGLGGFYFVGKDMSYRNHSQILNIGCNAVFEDNTLDIHHNLHLFQKGFLFFSRKVLKKPTVFKYKKAIEFMVNEKAIDPTIIPVVAPNWDHSPRSGSNALILDDCNPKYFLRLMEKTIAIVSSKPENRTQIIVKSWNEWGEGNHLEPDLKYKRGYLEAIQKCLDDLDKK